MTTCFDGKVRQRVYEVFRRELLLESRSRRIADAKPLVRKTFDAFGPEHMIWGGLGHNMNEFQEAQKTFDSCLISRPSRIAQRSEDSRRLSYSAGNLRRSSRTTGLTSPRCWDVPSGIPASKIQTAMHPLLLLPADIACVG